MHIITLYPVIGQRNNPITSYRDRYGLKALPVPVLVRDQPVTIQLRPMVLSEDGGSSYPLPFSEIANVSSWSYNMDVDYNQSTECVLSANPEDIVASEVTSDEDASITYSQISIPLKIMDTVRLDELLGNNECLMPLTGELTGYGAVTDGGESSGNNGDGEGDGEGDNGININANVDDSTSLVVWQFAGFVIRNRISSSGTPFPDLPSKYVISVKSLPTPESASESLELFAGQVRVYIGEKQTEAGLYPGHLYYCDGTEWLDMTSSGGGDSATWGNIGGTLSNQTDLNETLARKCDISTVVTTLSGNDVSVEVGKAYSWNSGTGGSTLNLAQGTDTTKCWQIPIRILGNNITSPVIQIDSNILNQDAYENFMIVCDSVNIYLALLMKHVDNSLSENSVNPVQNKTIKTALDNKADLADGKVPSGQLNVATETTYGVIKVTPYSHTNPSKTSGLYLNNGNLRLRVATDDLIDGRESNCAIVPTHLNRAVRSVSPLITSLPSDAASPIAFTDASATTRNHSYTYTHTPDTAPTYQLPDVTDATITHEIVLYLDLTSTASFSFTDSEGTTIAVDLNGVTPALGEKWTVWCEYAHGAWIVRGMNDMEATA